MSNIRWLFTALLLLSVLGLISCQPQTLVKSLAENVTENISQVQQATASVENITLESGFEIPQGTAVDREPIYDDVIVTPGGSAYRSNVGGPGEMVFETSVKSTLVHIGDGFDVYYRDNIVTKAGQVRYNIIETGKPFLMADDFNVELRLANMLDDIKVEDVGEGGVGWNQVVLQIEITNKINPGDYKLIFFHFINGKYSATLPCIVHVIE